MRALITGINGFVGGHLAEHLLSQTDWGVYGLARQSQLALPLLHERVQLSQADLNDQDQALAALDEIRPEVIFHLAGQSNVPRSFADPLGTFQMNVVAQINLFQALLKVGIKPLVLIAGSNEIYGRVQPDELPINEDTPLRPVSPYAVSKASQDLLAYQYHASHGLRTIRMRPFNHIGPRQSPMFVCASFAQQVARIEAGLQPPVLQVGNLEAERDFTDVRDIAHAYALAATKGEVGAAYNVGSGRPISIRAILETFVGMSATPITVEVDPERMRPVDVPRIVCDSRRFYQHTGWEPQIPFEQTLRDILDDARTRVAQGESR